MELIRTFGGLGKGDAALAGGKGASLGEMAGAGIPVPPGFVVLANAFERFIEETDLATEIDAAFHEVNRAEMHTVERASATIQQMILKAVMPEDIRSSILQNYRMLDAEFVAVRSSATAEDSASAAWAGQLDSFLNTTEESLLKNVQRCWASLFTPRAIFYRFEKELHLTKISVAVVVQKMVQSEVSGIAFSVHPVTEDRNQLIIEAGFGLGEAIVSGQVTPDSYVVEKVPRRIIDTNVSTQSRGLYKMAGSASALGHANEWQNIPEPKASSQVLTEAQVFELSDIILKIENHYGFPCDIEWAFEGGKFYIVQSRPITTLAAVAVAPPSSLDFFKPEQYQRLFRVQGLRFFITDIWMDHYKHLDALTMVVGDEFRAYMPHGVIERTLAEGTDLMSNAERFEEYEKEFRAYMKDVQLFIESFPYDTASKQEVEDLLKKAAHLFFYYSKTEFFSTDGAYKLFTETKDKGLEKRLERMGNLKNDGRSFLNSMFFGAEAVLSKLLTSLGQRFGIEERVLQQYSRAEVLTLFNGGRVTDEEIERRNTAFYVLGKDGTLIIKTGPEVVENVKAFLGEAISEHTDALKGTSAHPGKVRGTARVIEAGFDNFDTLHKLMDAMQQGEILIAETTSPDLMAACKKAAAIVTNQGGMLSHAAIVSREMGIPCVVGTGNATEVIKNGDLVEVDANTGVVKILQRTGEVEVKIPTFKKHTYQFVWGNIQTMQIIEDDAIAFVECKDNPWNVERDVIWFAHGNKIQAYYSEEDFARSQEVGRMFLDTQAYESWLGQMEKDVAGCFAYYARLRHIHNFQTLSKDELLELFLEGHRHWQRVIGHFKATQPQGFHELLVAVGSQVTEEDLATLLLSPELDDANKEMIDWWTLVQEPFSPEALLAHARKYPWVASVHFTYDDVVDSLKGRYQFDKAHGSAPHIEQEKLELREKQKPLLEKYAKVRPLIERLQRLSLSRMEIKAAWAGIDFYLIPIMQEIARQSGEDLLDINWHYRIGEVESLLQRGVRLSSEVKEARKKCFVALIQDGEVSYWEGTQGEQVIEQVLGTQHKASQTQSELRGKVAHPGLVTGVVRILHANDVAQSRHLRETFKKGEILVTEMTQPNIMDIAARAGAIVTDEGSLLSHAAIVSRELKIPCIVNTAVATKVLHEGDVVEVDANTGIVKILEK